MNIFILSLLAFFLFFIIFLHFKKRSIIRKIKSMTFPEKSTLLNELAKPFGFCYMPAQDIFSSLTDSTQRKFGFTNAYDLAAPYLNMVYDYQTIYFDYNGKTWLIELWKGQYGINTGCEIGLYHADGIISPDRYSSAMFNPVSDDEMLTFNITLRKRNICLGNMNRKHWWLTIFDMGIFSNPKELLMEISISFPDCYMFNSFINSASKAMPYTAFGTCDKTTSFIFEKSQNRYPIWKSFVRNIALIWCRFLCMIFCFITRHFKRSSDKILYLYYYIPSAFKKAHHKVH